MSGLAPRAREDSVRPRRLSGVLVRPLNFAVRRRRTWRIQFNSPSSLRLPPAS